MLQLLPVLFVGVLAAVAFLRARNGLSRQSPLESDDGAGAVPSGSGSCGESIGAQLTGSVVE
jgi:hypothetical protein